MSFHYIYMDSDIGIQPTVSQGQTPLWLLRENKRGSVKSGDIKLKKKKYLEGRGGVLTVEKKALKRCLEFECLGLGFGVLFLTPSGSRGIVYSGYFQNLTCLMQT